MSRHSHNYARFAKKMQPHLGEVSGLGDMRGLSGGISRSVVACLAVLGGAGVGGLAAGFNAREGLSPPPPSSTVVAAVARMAPSDTVNLRFPADWAEVPVEPVSHMVKLASADPGMTFFSPQPAYAPGDADAPTMVEAKPKPAAPAPAKVALASVSAKPAKPPRSNAVLNDSQIAGIKKRLSLTPDQERYWPAVEAELRKMEYTRKPQGGSRTASIDMSKVNVEGLKSAGFPLVMSFSDDQRRELKSLAHLLGLESVMAGL
jgi:hypothetical protein